MWYNMSRRHIKESFSMQDFKTLVQEKTYYKCFCRVGDGTDCPPHWHESYEICQVLSGKVSFIVDGTAYEIEKGDLVCVNAAVPHFTCGAEENTRLRVFRTLHSNLAGTSAQVKPLRAYIPHAELALREGLEKRINALLDMILEENNVAVDASVPFTQAASAALYFLLMEHFPLQEEYKSKNTERRIFFETLDYVNAHFTEPINASILSKKLFYHRARLSSVFTKYTGERLGDYINGLRVQRVNELLRRGEGITKAALSSGFQSIRSFNNIYKNVMGISPSEYLKN